MKVCLCFRIFGGAVLASTLAACGHPEQKFAVTVTNESGKPMSGIECKAWFKKPGKESAIQDYFVTGATDANGKVELAGETIWAPTSVEARKSGYYLSLAGKHWTERRSGNRWEPWPVELKLVMKKIRNPHPMYALNCGSSMIFAFPNKTLGPYGFDLEAMDWVSPHGTGKISDFILQGVRQNPEDRGFQPNGWLRLSFSNEGDGILSIPRNEIGDSLLRSPSEAPLEGYQSSWDFPNFIDSSSGSNKLLSEDVFVFRVRTELDEQGNVVSSRYGKIYGSPPSLLSENLPSFWIKYYFNQHANERNLEWDMQHNLFRNLKEGFWPKNP